MLCYRCGSHVADGSPNCATCGQEFALREPPSTTGLRPRKKAPSSIPDGYSVGSRIADRYEVKAVVGQGTVGVVYLALDHEINVEVAVKVITPKLIQTDVEKRAFRSEARLVRSLSHIGCVRVYEDGFDGNRPFLVMQYLEGLSLRRIIDLRHKKEQRFELDEVSPILQQLCAVLGHAHRIRMGDALGVAHGHLKPENVIVLPDVLKVVGFRECCLIPRVPYIASQKGKDGDIAYLAPEVIDGKKITPASDMYSLGVLLGELLSGKVATPENEVDLIGVRGVPRGLDGVFRRLTAFRPQDRYQSINEVVEDIQAVLEGRVPPHAGTRKGGMALPRQAAAHHVDVLESGEFELLDDSSDDDLVAESESVDEKSEDEGEEEKEISLVDDDLEKVSVDNDALSSVKFDEGGSLGYAAGDHTVSEPGRSRSRRRDTYGLEPSNPSVSALPDDGDGKEDEGREEVEPKDADEFVLEVKSKSSKKDQDDDSTIEDIPDKEDERAPPDLEGDLSLASREEFGRVSLVIEDRGNDQESDGGIESYSVPGIDLGLEIKTDPNLSVELEERESEPGKEEKPSAISEMKIKTDPNLSASHESEALQLEEERIAGHKTDEPASLDDKSAESGIEEELEEYDDEEYTRSQWGVGAIAAVLGVSAIVGLVAALIVSEDFRIAVGLQASLPPLIVDERQPPAEAVYVDVEPEPPAEEFLDPAVTPPAPLAHEEEPETEPPPAAPTTTEPSLAATPETTPSPVSAPPSSLPPSPPPAERSVEDSRVERGPSMEEPRGSSESARPEPSSEPEPPVPEDPRPSDEPPTQVALHTEDPEEEVTADCPDGMVLIPGGRFLFGSRADDPMRNFAEHRLEELHLDAYCIDRYEYGGRGRRPVTGVTWYRAQELCESRGRRLCTEQEWEKACKGPGNLRFPYGNDFDPSACNTEDEDGNPREVTSGGAFSGCRSGYGAFDMAGNVAEWTATRFQAGIQDRTHKGGAANRPDWDTRCATRGNRPPNARDAYLGFRCCVDAR